MRRPFHVAGAVAATLTAVGGVGVLAMSSCTLDDAPKFDIKKINHLIVIYQENWSFDGLYSQFPGAHGLRFNQPIAQFDAAGNPITSMPLPLDATNHPFTSSVYPGPTMPVQFYNLSDFDAGANPWHDAATLTADITHRYIHEQLQIDGGNHDRTLFWSDVNSGVAPGGANLNTLAMSGVDATDLPEGVLAQNYVLCDNCFQSAFGGSFLNHQYLIAAAAPVFPNAVTTAPTRISAPVDPTKPGAVWDNTLTRTPVAPANAADAFAVNTIQPTFAPTGGGFVLPPLTAPTIATRMDAAKKPVSWKWYSEGWDTMNHVPTPANPASLNFQFHHQPFNYYAAFDPAAHAAYRDAHLQDLAKLDADLAAAALPDVSFIKLAGDDNEHPGYSALLQGQQAVANLVKKIQGSSAWKDCAIVITYDEFGGRYDHVRPPTVDAFGPGTRIPMIIVSPFAKPHYIDHTQYETCSVLSFIEHRWNLKPLGTRDAQATYFVKPFFDWPFGNG